MSCGEESGQERDWADGSCTLLMENLGGSITQAAEAADVQRGIGALIYFPPFSCN